MLLAVVVLLLLPFPVYQLTSRMPMLLAVAIPLVLLFPVCQPSTGLRVLLAVAIPLVPVRVCQPGTGFGVLLAVAVPVLVPVRVCQSGTSLWVLLAVAVAMLLPILVCQPAKLMHFDLMFLHTNLHFHRILCKLHNNFKCYKFILHDKFLILRKSSIDGDIYRFTLSFDVSFDCFLKSRHNKMKH